MTHNIFDVQEILIVHHCLIPFKTFPHGSWWFHIYIYIYIYLGKLWKFTWNKAHVGMIPHEPCPEKDDEPFPGEITIDSHSSINRQCACVIGGSNFLYGICPDHNFHCPDIWFTLIHDFQVEPHSSTVPSHRCRILILKQVLPLPLRWSAWGSPSFAFKHVTNGDWQWNRRKSKNYTWTHEPKYIDNLSGKNWLHMIFFSSTNEGAQHDQSDREHWEIRNYLYSLSKPGGWWQGCLATERSASGDSSLN